MAKRIYKTMQGREVDIEALKARNELTLAVGNGEMNARGDKVGKGGKIVKKREEVVAEYYDDNPNAVPKQNQKAIKTTATTEPERPATREAKKK